MNPLNQKQSKKVQIFRMMISSFFEKNGECFSRLLSPHKTSAAEQEVALSALIYSVKLFANILSLAFYKVIESSEIIGEKEFDSFIDVQF